MNWPRWNSQRVSNYMCSDSSVLDDVFLHSIHVFVCLFVDELSVSATQVTSLLNFVSYSNTCVLPIVNSLKATFNISKTSVAFLPRKNLIQTQFFQVYENCKLNKTHCTWQDTALPHMWCSVFPSRKWLGRLPGGEVRANISGIFSGSVRKLIALRKLVTKFAVVTMTDFINKVTRTPWVTIATTVTKIINFVCCIYANALLLFCPADRSERKIRVEARWQIVSVSCEWFRVVRFKAVRFSQHICWYIPLPFMNTLTLSCEVALMRHTTWWI